MAHSDIYTTPKVCPLCETNFRDKQTFRRHALIVHGGYRFQCPNCKEAFDDLDMFQDHIKTVHKQEPNPLTEEQIKEELEEGEKSNSTDPKKPKVKSKKKRSEEMIE